MLLYNSFLECYFNYLSITWYFTSNSNTYKIEKIQRKALRGGGAGVIHVIRDLPNICNVNCDLHIFFYVKRDWEYLSET